MKNLALALLLVLLAACSRSQSVDATKAVFKRPNVLIILADDLGYSDLGAFGSEIHTPNLDRLAAEGGLFTNFHSTPLCAPTRADLLTGADHHIVGVGALLTPLLPYQTGEDYGGFNDKARTVAEILQDAGYHTYMTGKWHLSTQGPEKWGFEKSFYLQPDAGAGNNFAVPAAGGNSADEGHFENGVAAQLPSDFFSSDYYTSKLINYIDQGLNDGKPFFAYLAFQATHNPLQAPDAYLHRYDGVYDGGYDVVRDARIKKQKALGIIPQDFADNPGLPITALSPSSPSVLINAPWSALTATQKQQESRQMEIYAGMLENLDQNVGRVLDELRRTGQYDNTLIVFLSDNGPDGNGDTQPSGNVDNSLENYGRAASYVTRSVGWSLVSSAPFKGFKASIYEGGTSVPAIVRLPLANPVHQQIGGLASVLDILPTTLAVANIPDPGVNYKGRTVAPLEGLSLLSALRGEDPSIRGPNDVLADEMYDHRYVVKGNYKLERTDPLYYGWSVIADHNWQLFDIKADRGENTVLSERDIHLPNVPLIPNADPDVVNDLVAQWQAYVQRTGLSLPPGE